MTGEERRKEIIRILKTAKEPVSGTRLAQTLQVSRQVIVQDIALIKTSVDCVFATSRGYCYLGEKTYTRVFKVWHNDDEIEEELTAIVDLGGRILDVFIKHKVYGEVHAPLNIGSRLKIREFVGNIKSGKSMPLKNLTANYHYHTVEADSEEILDLIQAELTRKNMLAPLLDYELGHHPQRCQ